MSSFTKGTDEIIENNVLIVYQGCLNVLITFKNYRVNMKISSVALTLLKTIYLLKNVHILFLFFKCKYGYKIYK